MTTQPVNDIFPRGLTSFNITNGQGTIPVSTPFQPNNYTKYNPPKDYSRFYTGDVLSAKVGYTSPDVLSAKAGYTAPNIPPSNSGYPYSVVRTVDTKNTFKPDFEYLEEVRNSNEKTYTVKIRPIN
jgi:hypothetical protein